MGLDKPNKIGVLFINKGKILLEKNKTRLRLPRTSLRGKTTGFPSLFKKQPRYCRKFCTKKDLSKTKPVLVEYSFVIAPNSLVPNKRYVWAHLFDAITMLKGSDLYALKRLITFLKMPKIIAVSGTPGTGKTTFSRKLSLLIRAKYLDVNKIIKKHRLNAEYDTKRQTSLIDIKKLTAVLVEEIKKTKKTLIIDSHLSHYLPSKYVDLCVITACSSLRVLESRLKKRGYNALKIRENLDSEIFKTCQVDALEAGHSICLINTKNKIDYHSFILRYNALLNNL